MWREIPLVYVILETIKKVNKPIKDEDLFEEVKREVNYDISFNEFLRALMELEMRGYISVSLIKENVRMIVYTGEKI